MYRIEVYLVYSRVRLTVGVVVVSVLYIYGWNSVAIKVLISVLSSSPHENNGDDDEGETYCDSYANQYVWIHSNPTAYTVNGKESRYSITLIESLECIQE